MNHYVFAPTAIAQDLAQRAKARRLQEGWTRDELARRAGITPASLKRFERTGQISLERLLKIALVLNARSGWDQLFRVDPTAGMTLRDLAKLQAPPRQRGRRRPRA